MRKIFEIFTLNYHFGDEAHYEGESEFFEVEQERRINYRVYNQFGTVSCWDLYADQHLQFHRIETNRVTYDWQLNSKTGRRSRT